MSFKDNLLLLFGPMFEVCVCVCVCACEQPEIFFSVMSESTWSEVLTEAQRQHLRRLLPHFPDNNVSEQDGVISDLFNDQNFFFGNPLHLAQKLFRGSSFYHLKDSSSISCGENNQCFFVIRWLLQPRGG